MLQPDSSARQLDLHWLIGTQMAEELEGWQ
jgi:hypothetical protein